MLVIDTSNLPSSHCLDCGAVQAVIANEDETTQAVQASSLVVLENAALTTGGTLNPTVVDGSTVTLVVPDGVSEIETITYNGVTYTLSEDPTTATPGTFIVDYDTGIITLETDGVQGITVNTNFQYTGLNGCYPDPVYGDISFPIPAFLSRINATGTVTVSRSFQSAPSAQVECYSTLSARSLAQAYNRNEPVDLWGCKLAIKNVDIQSFSGQVERKVSISLGSRHEYALGKTVFLKRRKSDKTTSLAELCRRAGTGYSGPSVRIKLPKDMPTSTTTTPGSEVESRAISERGFVFHSDSNIRIRRWRTGASTHYLSEADLLPGGSYTISYSGDGAKVSGVQLSKEWRNVRIELDKEGDDGESGQSNDRYTLTSRDITSVGQITADMIWPGGPNSTTKVTTYENGSIIQEEETVDGILVSPFDLISIYRTTNEAGQEIYATRLNPRTEGFGTCRKTTTTYIYDDEGYLIREETRGFEYTRINSGDPSSAWIAYAEAYDQFVASDFGSSGSAYIEALRSISAQYKSLIAHDFTKPPAGLYYRSPFSVAYGKTFKLGISETTTYELTSMVDVYPDIEKPSSGEEEEEEWVTPRYVANKTRSGGDVVSIANFESSSQNQLPEITVGKRFRDSEATYVVYPAGGVSKEEYNQSKDLFKVISKTKNQEGKRLENDLEVSNSTENKGRPSVHTRKQIFEGDPTAKTPEDRGYKHLANTPGSTYGIRDPETGSFSAPGIDRIVEAKRCAEVQAQIDNIGSASLSGTVRANTAINWEEGDIIVFKGQRWVLTSLNETYKVQGCHAIISEGWQFQCGIALNLNLNFNRIREDGEESDGTVVQSVRV